MYRGALFLVLLTHKDRPKVSLARKCERRLGEAAQHGTFHWWSTPGYTSYCRY